MAVTIDEKLETLRTICLAEKSKQVVEHQGGNQLAAFIRGRRIDVLKSIIEDYERQAGEQGSKQ